MESKWERKAWAKEVKAEVRKEGKAREGAGESGRGVVCSKSGGRQGEGREERG